MLHTYKGGWGSSEKRYKVSLRSSIREGERRREKEREGERRRGKNTIKEYFVYLYV